jgi:hypothetical protein
MIDLQRMVRMLDRQAADAQRQSLHHHGRGEVRRAEFWRQIGAELHADADRMIRRAEQGVPL